jgi:hypothetical protein
MDVKQVTDTGDVQRISGFICLVLGGKSHTLQEKKWVEFMRAGGLERMTMTRRGKRTGTRWALLSGNENFTRRVLERLERLLLYDLWLSEILNMGLCGDFLRQTNALLFCFSQRNRNPDCSII